MLSPPAVPKIFVTIKTKKEDKDLRIEKWELQGTSTSFSLTKNFSQKDFSHMLKLLKISCTFKKHSILAKIFKR